MTHAGIDVLVVGSGIAGCSAAIEAARAGARVGLCSLGDAFGGSSFYGGTWGLGLVGPVDDADADDLERTICDVGCGMARPELVRTLVAGIAPAVAWLEGMGVELRRPQDAGQREYVPCFDHKARAWHGLVREPLRAAWQRELGRLGVASLPRTELLDVVEEGGHVTGALLARPMSGDALLVPCGAVVLATGGLAGLYGRRLTAPDVCGAAHGIALAHGCALANAEFLQMMPGLVSPVSGVVVNEKALRWSTLPFDEGTLGERATYGPFTSRLGSHVVDLAMEAAGGEGVALSFDLPDDPPELVRDYFAWLVHAHGVGPRDEVRAALFAHASNGGIAIGMDGMCMGGPQGLLAAGECAGGMHGADRIGGLASASALVFGRAAGRAAATCAGGGHGGALAVRREWPASPVAGDLAGEMRAAMSAHAMVGRTAEGLAQALDTMGRLEGRLDETCSPTPDVRTAARTMRVRNQLTAARAMLGAMLARRESLGSHHRADAPTQG